MADALQTRVTLGVTGGVAAYKAAELVRLLQQRGAEVQVVMTRAAEEFIRPLTFSSLTGRKVITSMWGTGNETASSGLDDDGQIEHIAEAQWPQAIVIAPATAHAIAKFAHGLADDFLSTMLLAATCPVVVAPAMNVNMWAHPATQANVALLRARGVQFVEPESGYLACGMTGSGRLASVESIADAVLAAASSGQRNTVQDLAGETVLVTAGGTREPIDPVRFLGNRSSGKMGYALAEAARDRGAQVILVSAPTALTPPAGCVLVAVTTADEMHTAVMDHLPEATVVIGAAAVADFTMPRRSKEKLRREDALHLHLEPTEDILRHAARARRTGTLVIGFAAEMDLDVARAREKLEAKGVDAIVLNDVSREGVGFDAETNAGIFVTARDAEALPESSKLTMAHRVLDRVSELRFARHRARDDRWEAAKERFHSPAAT